MHRHSQLAWLLSMSFSLRLSKIRKDKKMTQQVMADTIGIHVSQIKRYESGDTQPSLDVLRKIAIALNISADLLLFDEGERDLPNNLQLKFEAVSQMSEEDQRTIQSLIDGMILKHTASQLGARQ
jgi:transcriptional regulator with XRE-family HTH domain